ncbi:MAG: HDIG domain-containing protein [Clostridiales bacterium]|nr:HDIG domain-containing protein [Clostridiales bacterium]
MAVREFGKEFTKSDTLKSALLFFVHFVIFVAIAMFLVVGMEIKNFSDHLRVNGANYLYALFSIFLLIAIMYFYFYFENKTMLSSMRNITLIFAVLDVYFIMSWFIGEKIDIYARPVAFVALMIYVLIGRREAIFMNIVSALLVFIIDTFSPGNALTQNEYYSSLIISFSAGMLAIFFCGKAKTRFTVVLIGIFIVIPIDVIIFLLEVSNFVDVNTVTELSDMQRVVTRMGYGLFGGVASTILFLTILPLFEWVFNCLTVYRLRELTSSDAKILKKLQMEAPGTYNHSMMVAQLAEACAAAIGENVDYARAAALYHDVGKLHNPEHFTENQGDYNLHDELSPELSADIIRSHANDGYALIRNHHLPDFLADVAVQHHGTMPIRYFYAKALKMTDGELNIEDFSYLGPKPQTKIAAIVMIADSSEAVVRAAKAHTPEAAEKCIRAVIEERMDLEQFSECDVTLADLTKIRLALVHALTGVNHHRIKYPNLKYKRTESGKTTGENE